jgi:TonB family protein
MKLYYSFICRILWMRRKKRLLAIQALLLSLLLHLLLAASFILVIQHEEQQEKPPAMYVPAYTYQPESTQAAAAQSAPATNEAKQTEKLPNTPNDKNQIALAHDTLLREREQQIKRLSNSKQNEAVSIHSKDTEALHLVGDKTVALKPLIRILGVAMAKHLSYPKIAVDFLLRGTAYVGFVIHPNGEITDVQLVQSSGAGVLDEEAIAGVRAMSPVKNVTHYVPQPKYLVVGIIFG